VFGSQCLAWTGSEYVAAFVVVKLAHGLSIISEVRARALTRDGALAGEPVPLSGLGWYLQVACASSDTATLFVWAGTRLDGALRTHAGAVTAAFPVVFHGSGDPSVASNGDGFLVAWSNGRVPVSETGTVGAPVASPEPATAGAWRDGYVLLSSSGTLTATPLDAQGVVVGEPVLLARDAASAELSGSTVIYQRDAAGLDRPRWQVFTRELSASPPRRRAMR